MSRTPFQIFLESKGIREDTAARWGIEDHGNEAHFRYPTGTKIRGLVGPRTFRMEGSVSPFYYRHPFHSTAFITEGESDAGVLDQALWDNGFGEKVSVVGIPGINAWKSEYTGLFRGVDRIRVVLDNDEDYNVRATVDKVYAKIANDLGRNRVRRIYLPDGTKDLVEFFQGYSWASFLEIAKPNNKTNYERLDLSAKPPLAEWLVEGLICKGDIAIVTGKANVGKSMIMAKGLALAVAEGWDRFLGKKLNVPPEGLPAMIIDKENPVDTVYSQLLGMGMTEKGMNNLHYYHMPDVRLDKFPEKLHDDAMIIKPAFIALDSLRRMYSGEEKDSGPISQVFNESIIPLGRETGAAVVVIHAVTKTVGSGIDNVRGSSDLGYVVDTGIEIESDLAYDSAGVEREALNIEVFKSRRASKGRTLQVFLNFGIVGDIELEVSPDGF